jgi:hypothetical protein
MEKRSHSNLWNLLLILLGAGLLIIASIDLLRPVRTDMVPASRDSNILEKNWFSERTFDLLMDGRVPVRRLDIDLIAELNPFKPVAPVVEPEKVEPPAVESKPKPPTATRRISVVYRGFYRSSGGDAFVYVEIEGGMRVVSIDGPVAPGWEIDEVNASQLTLKRGADTRVQIPFNQKKDLEVAIN